MTYVRGLYEADDADDQFALEALLVQYVMAYVRGLYAADDDDEAVFSPVFYRLCL